MLGFKQTFIFTSPMSQAILLFTFLITSQTFEKDTSKTLYNVHKIHCYSSTTFGFKCKAFTQGVCF